MRTKSRDQLSFFDPPPPPCIFAPILAEPKVGEIWVHKYEWMRMGRLVSVRMVNDFNVVAVPKDKTFLEQLTRSREDWTREARKL